MSPSTTQPVSGIVPAHVVNKRRAAERSDAIAAQALIDADELKVATDLAEAAGRIGIDVPVTARSVITRRYNKAATATAKADRLRAEADALELLWAEAKRTGNIIGGREAAQVA